MSRFSDTLMDHFQSPRNSGRLEDPDFVGLAGVPGQGRYLVLYVRVSERSISHARFECHGCGVTIACGSVLTELILGRTIEECTEITAGDLVEALDGVPPDRGDCPEFALHALGHVLGQIESTTKTTISE